jgi:hypothetical protein
MKTVADNIDVAAADVISGGVLAAPGTGVNSFVDQID